MNNADRLTLARHMGIPNTVGFDPYENANDDYAVLEWARCNWLTKDPPNPDHPNWDKFCDAIWETPTLHGCLLFYKVGDYARAALKVLP